MKRIAFAYIEKVIDFTTEAEAKEYRMEAIRKGWYIEIEPYYNTQILGWTMVVRQPYRRYVTGW